MTRIHSHKQFEPMLESDDASGAHGHAT